ncbi:DUF2017 family protein [Microbacterium maritypicum]|uniref:Uncharacterized protein n=1 Tax=Microbacterium maritypicum MF109 TaxID=1333857 RepID=T5KE29_MICMQ|nr:DUF2017 family protein [Microbacterium liquefaciens]EQM74410.1 hypothetical protein L687_02845 [Microbacterium maritypicum MF109]
MTRDAVIVTITGIEELHLAKLVDDFIELLATSREVGDPAIDRLTPTPYPDDADSAADFAESTRDDLLDRRLADARRTRGSLGDVTGDDLAEAEALRTRETTVPVEDVDAWLRTLTAIRLVIATRLGITTDEQTATDGRHDVYDWLGYRLELLIQAADEADEGRKV